MTDPQELIAALEKGTVEEQADLLLSAIDLAKSRGWISEEQWRKAHMWLCYGAYHDAAMALVPEGHYRASGYGYTGWAHVSRYPSGSRYAPESIHAATEPLAIAAASIRAHVGGE